MKDFNLFLVYNEKATNTKFGYGIVIILVLAAIALPVLYRYTLVEEASFIRIEAEDIERRINSPQINEQLTLHDATLAQIETLKIYANAVINTVEAVERSGTLSSYNFTDVADALPLSVNIESFQYTNLIVELLLAFPERITAAEIINLLKQADHIDRVQLKTITERESDIEGAEPYYDMTVSVKLREGVLR